MYQQPLTAETLRYYYCVIKYGIKRQVGVELFSWANHRRQADSRNVLRHISMAWRKPQGTRTGSIR